MCLMVWAWQLEDKHLRFLHERVGVGQAWLSSHVLSAFVRCLDSIGETSQMQGCELGICDTERRTVTVDTLAANSDHCVFSLNSVLPYRCQITL